MSDLYILIFHGTITRASIDHYKLVKETPACWIVEVYGAKKRMLKDSHRGFTDIDSLREFVNAQVAKELAEARALIEKLENRKGIPVHKRQSEKLKPMTKEQLAKAFG